MVSDFWNEIHIPQRTWKCLVYFLGLAHLYPGHAHCPGLSPYWFGVGIVQIVQSKIWWWWWRFIWRTCSKMNNSQVMIQKPFLGPVAGAKYDYFMFFKSIGKLGLFWSEIQCRLIIRPSVTLKSNISLDIYYIFHKQSLLCTHRAH